MQSSFNHSSPVLNKRKMSNTNARESLLNPILHHFLATKPTSESILVPLGSHFQSSTLYSGSLFPDCRVLIVGSGALGCELLKNVISVGFTRIDILDMDTIELSNLNRQFLFRESDVGASKAIVAASRFSHLPGLIITPHACRLEDKPLEFFANFHLILCGLDSLESRRYLNTLVCCLAAQEGLDQSPAWIDAGTEGYKGHVRLLLPHQSCLECTVDLWPPARTAFPICTIANRPRSAAHCIEYASLILFPAAFSQVTVLDPSQTEHVDFVYEAALRRAAEFGISGVTRSLVVRVLRGTIPALASTTSIVAAAAALEAYKLVSGLGFPLADYMMVNGAESLYTFTFQTEIKPDCPVCSQIDRQARAAKEA